jgi:cytochrome P450 family 6
MGALLYLIIFVIAIAYYWVKQRNTYWRDRGFLQTEISFPFGSLNGVNRIINLAEKLDVYYKQFKGQAAAVGGYFFLSPLLIAIDPELIKNIFVRDFSSFHDRGFYYNKKDDPISAK